MSGQTYSEILRATSEFRKRGAQKLAKEASESTWK